MESRLRASPEQLSTLLEYMETHGNLSRPLPGLKGRVWADLKSKTKKKALTIRYRARGTGGGPAGRQTLSASDERVLAIMGALAVEGLVKELGYNRPQNSAEDDPIAQDDKVYLEIVDETQLTSSPQPSTSQPSPPAPSPSRPAPAAQSPPAPAAPTTLRRRRPSAPRASVTSPSARRCPRLRSPATPQSAAFPDRPRLRARRRRAPTPFERAATEFTAVELRRLELEGARNNQQHERDLRALEVEHERNQVFRSIVDVARGLA